MARPSKYTPELVKRIKQYISDGLTVRDACYGVGISEDTFCRWRREKPEFAKLVQEATEAQCWSSAGLARTSEYRRYQRRLKHSQAQLEKQKGLDTHLCIESALETTLNAPQSSSNSRDLVSSAFGAKLETRTSPPTNDFGELACCKPYYNSETNKVEWIEREMYRRPILHRCSLEKWQELMSHERA